MASAKQLQKWWENSVDGGQSYLPPASPTSPRGASWSGARYAALTRDNYTCQKCGVHAKKGLHVHHIVPFRCFSNQKDANALDNLQTLCARCHKEEERVSEFSREMAHDDYIPYKNLHVRHDNTWRKARLAALHRDNSTCQSCGDETDLHVHHIKPKRLFKSAVNANKLKNLVTLCGYCHVRAEETYKIFHKPRKEWDPKYIRVACVSAIRNDRWAEYLPAINNAWHELFALQRKGSWRWRPGETFVVLPIPRRVLGSLQIGFVQKKFLTGDQVPSNDCNAHKNAILRHNFRKLCNLRQRHGRWVGIIKTARKKK